jgi:CheY-like chemotaxis protein
LDIFMVDDGPVSLELCTGILNEYGYQVRVATTGQQWYPWRQGCRNGSAG